MAFFIMKKINVLLTTVIVFFAVACTQENNLEEDLAPLKFYKSYISTYVDCKGENSMRIQVFIRKIDESTRFIGGAREYAWSIGETNPNTFSVADGIGIDIFGHWLDPEHSYWDTCIFYYNESEKYAWRYNKDKLIYDMDRKKGFEKYSTLIGDTCYNKILRMPPVVRAIITPLQYITITANKDFSEEYKSGSDLSGFFTVYFEDPYSVIKNGYKDVENTYKEVEGLSFPQSIVRTLLSEANFPERPFIGDNWLFFLNVAPEKTDEYIFHITATYVDGTILEVTAPPINIQGR
jgi:hypothetical protein